MTPANPKKTLNVCPPRLCLFSGTFESELCPNQRFLCGDVTDTFDRCMHAIDCKMNYEMRIEKVQ